MKNKIKRKQNKTLKWGISGCGKYTENSFLPALKTINRNKFYSVYSSDLSRASSIKEKFGGTFSHSNFYEFLKDDFSALYISGKNANHYSQVIKAAEAGKHILCEKPLAISYKQAEEMVKVCQKNKVQFAVNYVYRFHPLVIKAKEILQKGMLGKIVSISADFLINLPPSENFRFYKEQSGGGALRDLGTHMIDILRFFGGEISEIKGYYDNTVYQSEVDDFAMGILKFQKSGYGRFNVSYNAKKAFNRIDIVGYKGCLSIEHFIGRKNASSKLIIDLEGESRKTFRKKANNLVFLLRSVSEAFRNNSEPAVTGYDGLVNMKLMEELEKSSKK